MRERHDYYGGALMALIGLAALVWGQRYDLGTLGDIGPGMFPAAVGGLLAVTGVAIALTGRPGREETTGNQAPDWRGWSCIIGGCVAFVVLGVYGGLVPATFAIVFISALGDRDNSWRQAAVLATAVVLVAVAVFWWALQLQMPLFAWGR